jgi:hypothetical protein
MNPRTETVSESRAEKILKEWANLHDEDLFSDEKPVVTRLRSRYPEIFCDPVLEEAAGSDFRWIAGIRAHLRAAWDAPNQEAREWYIFKVRDLYARVLRLRSDQRTAEALSKLRIAFSNEPGVPFGQEKFAILRPGDEAAPTDSVISVSEVESEENFAGLRELGARLRGLWTESGMLVWPPPPRSPFEQVMGHFQRRSRCALHCANPSCPAPYCFKEEGVRTQLYCGEDCSRVARLESKGRWWNEVGKARRESARTGGTQHGRRGKK